VHPGCVQPHAGAGLAAFVAAHWPGRLSHLVLIDPARLSFDSPQDADDFHGLTRGRWRRLCMVRQTRRADSAPHA
jgi:hypothetical protein